MPAANDAWVRRVGLSKIIATVRGPAERLARRTAPALSVGGQVQHLGLLGRGQVVVAQEVPGHRRPPRPCGLVEDRRPGGQERVGLVVGEDQRRGEPDPVGRRVVDDEAVRRAPRRRPRRTRVGVEVEPDRAARAPRTSVTRGSAASPSRSRSPSSVTWSSSPSFSMVSMTASAAAQATGLPPNVVPWLPGCSRSPASPSADAGADRDAAAEALGQGDDVGRRRREPAGGRTTRRCGRCRSAPRRATAARRARR